MSIPRFVPVIAMAALLWAGCATRDPLAGWRVCCQPYERTDPRYDWADPHRGWNLDKAITEDFRSYIETIPREERRELFESNIFLLEDGTGKRAIRIAYPVPGLWSSTWWTHDLIYDANNKRIQTTKYKSGHSIR
jgi:hypothetical protein